MWGEGGGEMWGGGEKLGEQYYFQYSGKQKQSKQPEKDSEGNLIYLFIYYHFFLFNVIFFISSYLFLDSK